MLPFGVDDLGGTELAIRIAGMTVVAPAFVGDVVCAMKGKYRLDPSDRTDERSSVDSTDPARVLLVVTASSLAAAELGGPEIDPPI